MLHATHTAKHAVVCWSQIRAHTHPATTAHTNLLYPGLLQNLHSHCFRGHNMGSVQPRHSDKHRTMEPRVSGELSLTNKGFNKADRMSEASHPTTTTATMLPPQPPMPYPRHHNSWDWWVGALPFLRVAVCCARNATRPQHKGDLPACCTYPCFTLPKVPSPKVRPVWSGATREGGGRGRREGGVESKHLKPTGTKEAPSASCEPSMGVVPAQPHPHPRGSRGPCINTGRGVSSNSARQQAGTGGWGMARRVAFNKKAKTRTHTQENQKDRKVTPNTVANPLQWVAPVAQGGHNASTKVLHMEVVSSA